MNEISNTKDVLDVRDIIERFEELENIEIKNDDEDQEFQTLQTLLDDLKGNGGDEQWRGDWYPVTLIRDSYFVDYCEELVSDIGDLPREIPAYISIDWEETADNLRVDYSFVEYDGVEYLYR